MARGVPPSAAAAAAVAVLGRNQPAGTAGALSAVRRRALAAAASALVILLLLLLGVSCSSRYGCTAAVGLCCHSVRCAGVLGLTHHMPALKAAWQTAAVTSKAWHCCCMHLHQHRNSSGYEQLVLQKWHACCHMQGCYHRR